MRTQDRPTYFSAPGFSSLKCFISDLACLSPSSSVTKTTSVSIELCRQEHQSRLVLTVEIDEGHIRSTDHHCLRHD